MRYVNINILITSAKEVMYLSRFVGLSVCDQDYLKSCG